MGAPGRQVPLAGDLFLTTPSLVGAWTLVRWEIGYSDGRSPTYPFGPDATGLICYTHDGWMNACIARADRPRLSSDTPRSAPAQEQLAAFGSFFQYAGRYTVRDAPADAGHGHGAQQVVHQVTHALNPNFVGQDQVRDIQFEGAGNLTLSASEHAPGRSLVRHHRLLWRRAS